MIRLIRYLTLAIILFLVLIGTGCVRPNVPTEVVTLSYTLGQDLDAIHVSYRNLINSYFDSLRMQAQNILDDHWNPAFIKDFIQRANLVQLASTANDTQSYNQIVAWANAAVKQIETKKKEVMDPIDQDETKLLNYVDQAFRQVNNANNTITAHLNSIRKVQTLQDNVLQTLGLKDINDKVNSALISASDKLNKTLQEIQRVDTALEPPTKPGTK